MNTSGEKQGVILLYKYRQLLEQLPSDEQGKILMASLLYDETGEETEFDNPVTKMLFSVMKIDFDNMKNNWEAKKKSNHERAQVAAGKRWHANNANSTTSINENANDALYDNDNDSVNDSDSDSVNENIERAECADAPRSKKFTPPTAEEVREYCETKGYDCVNAETFTAHYASIGWKVGKNKMQNWHSAAAGWEARERERRGLPPQSAEKPKDGEKIKNTVTDWF